MSFVQIESLTKKFGDLTAVNDVSFEIEKGETVGLLGAYRHDMLAEVTK